jgi:WD40 repeat protein
MISKDHKILALLIIMTLTASGLIAWHLFGEDILNVSHNNADILAKFAIPASSITPVPSQRDTLIPLSKVRAISLAINKSTNEVQYYDKTNGNVLAIGFNGTRERVISATPLANFLRTMWSPGLQEVVSVFARGTSISLRHFNYATKKTTPLPDGTTAVAFSPNGSQIAYFQKGDEQSAIFVGTPTTHKKLLDTRSEVTDLRWPSERLIALTMSADNGTAALFTLTSTGELARISDFTKGLTSQWSRNGSHVLYSFFDADGKLHLIAHDLTKGTETAITPAAHASQCTWSIDEISIICGVEEGGQSGDQLVRQHLIRITLASGERTPIPLETSKPTAIEEILLSPLEDYVILLNAFDHKVYSVKLP